MTFVRSITTTCRSEGVPHYLGKRLKNHEALFSRFVPLNQARQRAMPIDWSQFEAVRPTFIGTRTFLRISLAKVKTQSSYHSHMTKRTIVL